jgi:hypothetical protein
MYIFLFGPKANSQRLKAIISKDLKGMPPTNYILPNSQHLTKQVSRKAHKENALKDDQQFGFTKRWFNAKTQRKTHAKSAQVLL